ncbi:MAG TPA: hypothetical protein VKA15_09530, partial [Isosphaeraceae bacterium]|nr:hypothetical protein [Isosphaeraceae bacterium]
AAPIGLFAAALVERVDKLDPLTRERCFFGLRNCRNRDLLDNGVIAFPALVGLLRDFAMAERQGSAASADREVGARVGSTIRAAGYPDLGALLAPRGPGDARLAGILAEILRGYFLVEVAKDAELSAGFLCANRERRTRTAGRKRTRATWRGTTRPSARRS